MMAAIIKALLMFAVFVAGHIPVHHSVAVQLAPAPVVVHHDPPPVPATPAGPTYWPALNAAISRIPNLQPSIVHWVVEDRGDWADTDLSTGTVYVAPRAPVNLLFSIVAHEYGHVLQGRIYGGLDAAVAGLQPFYGYVGELAIERAADCMALLEGATWTNYTTCQNAAWRQDAAILLSGRRLS